MDNTLEAQVRRVIAKHNGTPVKLPVSPSAEVTKVTSVRDVRQKYLLGSTSSLLCQAVNAQDMVSVQILLDTGDGGAWVDQYGRSVLYVVCGNTHENVELARLLVRYAVSDGEGITGKESFVDQAEPQDGLTPLMLAISNGHSGLVAFLLEEGANPLRLDKKGITPLQLAKALRRERCAEIMETYNPRARMVAGFYRKFGEIMGPPILAAATMSDMESVRALVENDLSGCILRTKDEHGETVLHKAVYYPVDNVALVTYLIGLKDGLWLLEEPTYSGITPLMWAAGRNRPKILKFLLGCGARVEKKTKGGATAYDFAERFGHTKCLNVIVEHSSDDMLKLAYARYEARCAISKEHPLLEAVLDDDLASVRAFLKGGVDPTIRDYQGTTALQRAAFVETDNVEMVSALLDAVPAGRLLSFVNATNAMGTTATMFAARRGNARVSALLEQHGATPAPSDGRFWGLTKEDALR